MEDLAAVPSFRNPQILSHLVATLGAMRKKLKKFGNSWGIILTREVLDLLEVDDELDFQVVGNTVMISAPDADAAELEAALNYLMSQRNGVSDDKTPSE